MLHSDPVPETSNGMMEDDNEVPETPRGTNAQTNSEERTISLEEAMKTKFRVRSKSLQATHHREFLSKCIEAGRVPKGLQLQQKEVHLLDTPTAVETRARLTQIYRLSEHSIMKALIEHYASVQKESKKHLRSWRRRSGENYNKEDRKSRQYTSPLWRD